MQRFRKRVRLLAEKLGGTLDDGDGDSLTVRFDARSAHFVAMPYDRSAHVIARSYDVMDCSIDLGEGSQRFSLEKSYVFDIVDRLASPHLASSLHSYPKPELLELDDDIHGDRGAPNLQSLRDRIAANPSLVHADLGGDCVMVEYYRGVLILRDELMTFGTTVVDF